jgi:hypothetical protein
MGLVERAPLALRTALTRALAGACMIVLLTASPAGADPAKPGDYTSTVTRVEPTVPGITVKVVGGDGFLELKVQPGHDVIVLGYAGGPWLHVRPDGIVEENQLSPATFLNGSRFAQTVAPNDVTEDTEKNQPPEYKQVATDGTYAWHDHRIHWMSPQPKADAHRGAIVPGFEDWKVPMIVDGTSVTVHGQLVYEKSVSPLPWFALAVLVAAAAFFLGRGKSTFVAAVAVLLSSVAALEAGIVAYRSIPSVAGPNPLEIALPAVATVAGLCSLLLHRKPLGVVFTLASVASLSGWAFMRLTVLFNPVLPTDLPFGLDRAATACALGCSLAAAVLAVRSGALVLRLPELDFDDEDDAADANADRNVTSRD